MCAKETLCGCVWKCDVDVTKQGCRGVSESDACAFGDVPDVVCLAALNALFLNCPSQCRMVVVPAIDLGGVGGLLMPLTG